MKKKETVSGNYLDCIPCHNAELSYVTDEKGNVTLLQENRGMFNYMAQKIFRKPRISQIHLDEMGNFIWPLIDGERTIYDISVMVKEKFGDKAEPLYNRLVQYIRNLESYGFIQIMKTENK